MFRRRLFVGALTVVVLAIGSPALADTYGPPYTSDGTYPPSSSSIRPGGTLSGSVTADRTTGHMHADAATSGTLPVGYESFGTSSYGYVRQVVPATAGAWAKIRVVLDSIEAAASTDAGAGVLSSGFATARIAANAYYPCGPTSCSRGYTYQNLTLAECYASNSLPVVFGSSGPCAAPGGLHSAELVMYMPPAAGASSFEVSVDASAYASGSGTASAAASVSFTVSSIEVTAVT